MYPSRYGGGLSYAEKFDSILHFYTLEKRWKKVASGEQDVRSMTSFFSSSFLWGLPAPP
jgi:hypothetical protein